MTSTVYPRRGVLLAAVLTPLLISHIGWRGMFVIGVVPAVGAWIMRRKLHEPELFTRTARAERKKPNTFRLLVADGRTTRVSIGIVQIDAHKASAVMKLYYRSFLDGDDFARSFLKSPYLKTLSKRFEESLEAARKAGDAEILATPIPDLFWYVQHVASAACLMRLRKPPVVRYETPESDIVRSISLFALRGVGLSEKAIAQHGSSERLGAWLRES